MLAIVSSLHRSDRHRPQLHLLSLHRTLRTRTLLPIHLQVLGYKHLRVPKTLGYIVWRTLPSDGFNLKPPLLASQHHRLTLTCQR